MADMSEQQQWQRLVVRCSECRYALEDALGVLARQLDIPDVDRLISEAALFLCFDVDHLATLDVTDEVDCLGTLSPRHDRGWWCC